MTLSSLARMPPALFKSEDVNTICQARNNWIIAFREANPKCLTAAGPIALRDVNLATAESHGDVKERVVWACV